MSNIFFTAFDTPHGVPPFDRITHADYEPAIMRGIEEHNREVDAIAHAQSEPTFDNTIVALERSGQLLDRVLNIFFPMLSADADDELLELSTRLSPILSEHSTSITLNEDLWQRVKHVYEHFDRSAHDHEDWMLLEKTHRSFERSGATLQGDDRERFRELSKRLSSLTLQFEQNHLKELAQVQMWLAADDLEGLPDTAVETAAEAAREQGRDGEFLFTLQAPSYGPFMKYSARRDLREKLYRLYNRQGTAGEFSNVDLVRDIVNTRLELARLFGYNTFADYRLVTSMAQTPQHVYELLEQLRTAYQPVQRDEMERLTAFATQFEGHPTTLMPWDYAYYANKEKEAKYAIDDELLRPYFRLENVTEGVLGLATRLYGLHFTENTTAPVFHPDVKVFDVTGDNGSYVGTLYTDFFPRATKQSGAWMTNFAEQWLKADGTDVRPIVTLTMNFTRPTDTRPSLLTFGEVRTFMHEFGHGLHSLLSQCKYVSTSGTNVYRDFVELPSQLNENFLRQREFLDSFARHWQTGEPIPQELIDRLQAAERYGAGYACLRQLSFGLLDMAWHTISKPFDGDVATFERNAMAPVKMFEPIDGCMMSTQFSHIFAGGYAAGYYGYKWAEVLDADAFERFEQEGVFNTEVASQLRAAILSRGSSDEPMTLYRQFRGREPRIDALLRRDGILQ